MLGLQTGVYARNNDIKVTVWPKPSVDGDGPEVWHDVRDDDGNYLGREPTTDANGGQLHHHTAPEGFIRIPTQHPGMDGQTETWVRDGGRGTALRNAAGEAVSIREGHALIEYPDGSWELLKDGYSQRQFEKAHTLRQES